MAETAIITLLHVLVFVYWLGGDLGAFYSSRFLTADGVSVDRRLFAAKIVGDVDMAPRTALILAFPTGFHLASVKGWITVDAHWIFAAWAASLAWLTLAWFLHVQHGASATWKSVDLAIRWAALAALAGTSFAALTGTLSVPAFLALKMLLLATAIGLGLLIRRMLQPLGPALVGLTGDAPETATQSLATTINTVRPAVMGIWLILVTSALLGLWTPTAF
ncbi:MAG: hypothetical protein AAGJ32_10080 [Pseudomonadota bacterium]